MNRAIKSLNTTYVPGQPADVANNRPETNPQMIITALCTDGSAWLRIDSQPWSLISPIPKKMNGQEYLTLVTFVQNLSTMPLHELGILMQEAAREEDHRLPYLVNAYQVACRKAQMEALKPKAADTVSPDTVPAEPEESKIIIN